nr:hypothetical protein [Pseudomonas sp.]
MTTSRAPRVAPEVAARRAALLEELNLPISGSAYRKPVKIAAWIVLGLLTAQLISVATRLPTENLNQALTLTVVFCYVGMAVITVAMQRSVTTIDADGLRQTWVMRREIAWEDINFVKFIPYPLGKRLMIFNRGGRFITLQAGSRDVEVAFARIALVYKRTL